MSRRTWELDELADAIVDTILDPSEPMERVYRLCQEARHVRYYGRPGEPPRYEDDGASVPVPARKLQAILAIMTDDSTLASDEALDRAREQMQKIARMSTAEVMAIAKQVGSN